MLFRPTNPFSHRLARIAFILACVGALCVATAGPLHRYALIEYDGATGLFRYGFYVAAGGIALGLATIVPSRPGDRRRGFVAALLAIVIGAGAVVIEQDIWNVEAAQRGLHTLRANKSGTTAGLYQFAHTRHFHNLYDRYLGLKTPGSAPL